MSPSAWEVYWADYKLLKKIIKDCAQIKKEEKLQGDKLIKIKPSAKEDNDSIRAWFLTAFYGRMKYSCLFFVG